MYVKISRSYEVLDTHVHNSQKIMHAQFYQKYVGTAVYEGSLEGGILATYCICVN